VTSALLNALLPRSDSNDAPAAGRRRAADDSIFRNAIIVVGGGDSLS
jgi:hypothetical protein